MRSRARASEAEMTDARLFGLGLGPGDRLAHFCKRGRRGNARAIADAVVGADPAREIAMVYPVTDEIPAEHPDYAAALRPFYEEMTARLAGEVEAGRTVA